MYLQHTKDDNEEKANLCRSDDGTGAAYPLANRTETASSSMNVCLGIMTRNRVSLKKTTRKKAVQRWPGRNVLPLFLYSEANRSQGDAGDPSMKHLHMTMSCTDMKYGRPSLEALGAVGDIFLA